MSRECEFRAALMEPSAAIPHGLSGGAGRCADRRYNVYRNNVAVSLAGAIETGFPTVTRLIGEENLRRVASVFIRQSPPTSPILAQYGRAFPAFLAAFPPLAHLPYLSDIARVDLAMRESYHAADHTPLDPAALTGLEEDDLEALHLTLAPSLRLVSSNWPIHQIRAFTMGETQNKPTGGGEAVAILRPHFDPAPYLLPQGAYAFLSALGAGESFGAAQERAGPKFDLPATLTLLLETGALAAPETGAASC